MNNITQDDAQGQSEDEETSCPCGEEHTTCAIQVCRAKAIVETLRDSCGSTRDDNPIAARVEFLCESLVAMLAHIWESLPGNAIFDAGADYYAHAALERMADGETIDDDLKRRFLANIPLEWLVETVLKQLLDVTEGPKLMERIDALRTTSKHPPTRGVMLSMALHEGLLKMEEDERNRERDELAQRRVSERHARSERSKARKRAKRAA